MAKRKKEDPYDLCTCYEPTEPTPEEFIDPGDREPTIADTAFYLTDENGIEYYCCGNTKIKITEHFAEDGKSMGELLEDLGVVGVILLVAADELAHGVKLDADLLGRRPGGGTRSQRDERAGNPKKLLHQSRTLRRMLR